MRSSDVELPEAAAARILKQNDTAVFKDVVDYRATTIGIRGGVERDDDPFVELARAKPVARSNRSVGNDSKLTDADVKILRRVIEGEARPRSAAKDTAPRTKLCFCCGHLDGIKGYNAAHRKAGLI
jgi:hypothetical protein